MITFTNIITAVFNIFDTVAALVITIKEAITHINIVRIFYSFAICKS